MQRNYPFFFVLHNQNTADWNAITRRPAGPAPTFAAVQMAITKFQQSSNQSHTPIFFQTINKITLS